MSSVDTAVYIGCVIGAVAIVLLVLGECTTAPASKFLWNLRSRGAGSSQLNAGERLDAPDRNDRVSTFFTRFTSNNMSNGVMIKKGNTLTSPNGHFHASQASNGVFYLWATAAAPGNRTGKPLLYWSSFGGRDALVDQARGKASYTVMQEDGNLATYDYGTPNRLIWHSQSNNSDQNYDYRNYTFWLDIGNDGVLRIYQQPRNQSSDATVIWSVPTMSGGGGGGGVQSLLGSAQSFGEAGINFTTSAASSVGSWISGLFS